MSRPKDEELFDWDMNLDNDFEDDFEHGYEVGWQTDQQM